jgi:hypothetical protein
VMIRFKKISYLSYHCTSMSQQALSELSVQKSTQFEWGQAKNCCTSHYFHFAAFQKFFLPEKTSKGRAKSSSSSKKVLLGPSNKKMIWFGNRKEQANLITNADCSLNLLLYSLTILLLFHLNLRSLWFFSVCLIHEESFQIVTLT